MKVRLFCDKHPEEWLKSNQQETVTGGVDIFVKPCPKCNPAPITQPEAPEGKRCTTCQRRMTTGDKLVIAHIVYDVDDDGETNEEVCWPVVEDREGSAKGEQNDRA
jgi:hypothetical protein